MEEWGCDGGRMGGGVMVEEWGCDGGRMGV